LPVSIILRIIPASEVASLRCYREVSIMAGRQFFLFYCLLLAFPFSAKADDKLVELVKKIKPAVVFI